MFRHLVLIRHATAEERSWSKDDFARALTEKGHFQAKTLAALSDAAGVPAPDVVFSSGYRRAEETLRHFFNPDNVCLVRDATFAPEGGMKRTVQALFQGLERFEVGPQACTWVFGHNPHLESLLDEIAPRCLASLGAVQKGSLLWLEWESGEFRWGEEPRLRMALPKPRMKDSAQ
ncbi:MAG: histidine phosphatase family protein [Silvanigrellales bacterium]|jgi:phosphohistidine phosphatase SixA|nr:histidine phosphatase family protein [Silvanigrellales bacterium]